MDIHELIKKYGTKTISLMLKRYAETVSKSAEAAVLVVAQDLEEALTNYAEQDFEPPTVENRVI